MTDIDDALHEGAWREGYDQARIDILEWVGETLNEWRALGVYTHEELWGLAALHHELSTRTPRDETP